MDGQPPPPMPTGPLTCPIWALQWVCRTWHQEAQKGSSSAKQPSRKWSHWPRIPGLRKAPKTRRSASQRLSRKAHVAGEGPQNPRKGWVFLSPTLCLWWVLDCQTITIFFSLLLGSVQIPRPLPWAVGDRLWGRSPGRLYFTFIHLVIQQMFTQKTKVPNLSFPVHCLCDLGRPPQNPLNLQSEENGSQLEAGQTWVPAVGENLALINKEEESRAEQHMAGPGHWFGWSTRKAIGREWLPPQYHLWPFLCKSLCGHILHLQRIPRRAAASYAKCIFNTIWTWQIVFQNIGVILFTFLAKVSEDSSSTSLLSVF